MKLLQKIATAVTTACLTLAEAQAGSISITDFKSTSGANGRKVDDMLGNGATTMQHVLDFVFMVFTLVGIILVGVSLYTLYQVSKEEGREKPKSAIVGLIVGGALTAVGLITGYIANTIGV